MRRVLLPCTTILLLVAAAFPVLSAAPADTTRADGKTSVLTPQGTWITPPPGAPLNILPKQSDPMPGTPAPASASPAALTTCTPYEAGWYETNSASLYGGHVAVTPQNMPPSFTSFCFGLGLGYTAGVSFGSTSWIQAGFAIFPGETSAKWFCQSNDNGSKNTQYGTANSYGNGGTVYAWFARDSSGVWRTYRYDTGPYSIELPCTITRGASGNLQVYGELQGVTSTSAPMGPWKMSDLRYLPSSGSSWFVPTQLQASYPYGMTCPPYGAGTVSSGVITAGSGQTCATGASPYPN